MSKILILFASTTGNTEIMADSIGERLIEKGHDVSIKTFDFDKIDAVEVLDYDVSLIGTHTWDDGSLPFEVEDFYDEINEVHIENKVFGVFGAGDSFYEYFGGAVDLMAEKLRSLGAVLVPTLLKVDMYPDKEDIKRCHEFADMVCSMLEEFVKEPS